jgi:outer membrane protein assembly factor BamB
MSSCKEGVVEFNANNCKQNPSFIKNFGYNPSLSYFSTSDEKIMGLILKESTQTGNPNAPVAKQMQHPSWTQAGWLAPIQLSPIGDIYTAPAPFINILNNPISNNNTLYKVDAKSGEMAEFLKLPAADSINTENPFGIIAMAILCETNTLYVSTLAGSKRHKENGHIYAINLENSEIIDQIDNTDAMGMGISYASGKRKLYFGTGRSSDVYEITLNKKGKFSDSKQVAFSLQNLGPRGDDKVRKIRTDAIGNLLISGMEFNYNLVAPREKQETNYKFIYDEDLKKWNISL